MVTTSTKRPIYLNLVQIRLPVPGLMSIGHRISGVALVFCIPYFTYLLALSLAGPAGFSAAAQSFDSLLAKLILFLLAWGLLHHLLAGIRYLLLDVDLGVDRPTARATAWGVMLGAPLVAVIILGGLML
jgi:succinate dehydrogenase / fumarate reductase cytochrome b subunit